MRVLSLRGGAGGIEPWARFRASPDSTVLYYSHGFTPPQDRRPLGGEGGRGGGPPPLTLLRSIERSFVEHLFVITRLSL